MSYKLLTIIVDADGIIAQAHPDDANHQKAIIISKNLIGKEVRMIYPVTAVCEAITVLQCKLSGSKTAYDTAVGFINSSVELTPVTQEIYHVATTEFFHPKISKKNTLFDCIVVAMAQKYKADAIFSFDRFYKTKGFKLASEL